MDEYPPLPREWMGGAKREVADAVITLVALQRAASHTDKRAQAIAVFSG